MKRALDKEGRQISQAFMTLPDPDEIPDYYQVVTLPIAIDTLEEKLEKGQYPDLSSLEADAKRLVANAKKYNQTESQIFQDAERIRKLTFNWMSRHNPKGAQTAATPEPESIDPAVLKSIRARYQGSKPAPSPLAGREPSRSRSIKLQTPAPAATVSTEDANDDPMSFKGKTFQKAQEMVVQQCLGYQDPDSGLEIFTPFANLPLKRDVKDYYQIITDPQALTGVLKRVKGKKENGFTTDFKNWDAFEAEMMKVPNNARTYNEDGSEMFVLANEFEDHFRERLSDAKKNVAEPPQPTLKLNMGSKPSNPIKIRLGPGGSQVGSPVPTAVVPSKSASPAVNGAVDSRARAPSLTHPIVNGQVSAPQLGLPVQNLSPAPVDSGVKAEHQTPAPQIAQPQVNGLSNGSHAAMAPPMPRTTASPFPHNVQATQYPPYQQPPLPQINGLDSKWRSDGKTARDALLQDLQVMTDPSVRHSNPMSVTSMPQDQFCQRAITLNLAPSHRQLRLEPTFHQSLEASGGRPYRVFCTVNGNRLQPVPLSAGSNKLAYTVSLVPGMNRIEMEVVAAKDKSAEEKEHQGTLTRSKTTELDIERCSVFAHSLKM